MGARNPDFEDGKMKKAGPSPKKARARSAPVAAPLAGLHSLRKDDVEYAKHVGLKTYGAYRFDCYGIPQRHDVYWEKDMHRIRIAGINFWSERPLFKPAREVKPTPSARRKRK